MEGIVIELNGQKYINVEELIISPTDSLKLEKKITECECIVQGFKEVKLGRIFRGGYVIVNVLVPEESILKFSNYEFNEPKKENKVLKSLMFKFNTIGKVALNMFSKIVTCRNNET